MEVGLTVVVIAVRVRVGVSRLNCRGDISANDWCISMIDVNPSCIHVLELHMLLLLYYTILY